MEFDLFRVVNIFSNFAALIVLLCILYVMLKIHTMLKESQIEWRVTEDIKEVEKNA